MQNRLLDLQTENQICILCSILFLGNTQLICVCLYRRFRHCIGDSFHSAYSLRWHVLKKCCNNGRDCIRIVLPFLVLCRCMHAVWGKDMRLRDTSKQANSHANKLRSSSSYLPKFATFVHPIFETSFFSFTIIVVAFVFA